LFTAHNSPSGNWDEASIAAVSLQDGRRKTLVRGGTYGRYLPSGHLVYVNRGTLFAVPFDPGKLEVHGTPTPVLGDVGYSPHSGSAQLDFLGAGSAPGTIVYRPGGAGIAVVMVNWLDADGKFRPLIAKAGVYAMPRLSLDGERLALTANANISVYDPRRDTLTPVGAGTNPVWSPDGVFIVYDSPGGMFWNRSDGGGQPQSLTRSQNRQVPWSFSPDGKRLAFMEIDPETSLYRIWTVSVDKDEKGIRAGQPEPFLKTAADGRHPAFSPDGRWLAYASNESGVYEVYVRASPDNGTKWRISTDGGMYPVWLRSGHELLYRNNDDLVMTAAYATKGDTFAAEKPRLWSVKRLANIGTSATYDAAPDGRHIVAIMPAESVESLKSRHQVVFLLNFFDELRRRAPRNP
jgi:serine/threonine-protein kinase